MSVVVATAYMDEASRFDWLAGMDDGKVIAHGAPKEILARAQKSTLRPADGSGENSAISQWHQLCARTIGPGLSGGQKNWAVENFGEWSLLERAAIASGSPLVSQNWVAASKLNQRAILQSSALGLHWPRADGV